MNPILSIIVPCYNQAEFLPETLQSVLEQDFQFWECIIVNDGSKDDSEVVARDWLAKDSRFKYIYKENTGVSDTRNVGIREALGKYILPLDGDDRMSPQYTQKAITVLDADDSVKLVYSDLILFGAKNEKLITPPFVYEKQLVENQISCSGIYRKSDFMLTNGYNINMVSGLEDWDFWLSLLKKEDKVVKLEGFHIYYRIKEISRSTQINRTKNETLLLQIFKNHTDLYLEYINPIRDYLESEHYKYLYELYRDSPEYRIGEYFRKPIGYFRKIFNRKK